MRSLIIRVVESQLRALFVGGLPTLNASSAAAGQSSSARLPKLGRRLSTYQQIPVVEMLVLSRVLCCEVIRELKTIAARMRFASGPDSRRDCSASPLSVPPSALESIVQGKLRDLIALLAARGGPFARRLGLYNKAAHSLSVASSLSVALGAKRAEGSSQVRHFVVS